MEEEYILRKNKELGLGISESDINNVAIIYNELLGENGIYEFTERDDLLELAVEVRKRNTFTSYDKLDEYVSEETKINDKYEQTDIGDIKDRYSNINEDIINNDDYSHGL